MKIAKIAAAAAVCMAGLAIAPAAHAGTVDETTANVNATIVTPAQCKANDAAVAAGTDLPYIDEIRSFSQIPAYMSDGVVQYVVDKNFPYRKELNQAVADWNKALNGKVKLEEVSQPSDRTIRIIHQPRPNYVAVGEASTKAREIRIYISTYLYPESIQQTIAHEFGHIMTLAHNCSGTLMTIKGVHKTSPTPVDVAGVLQGRTFTKAVASTSKPAATSTPEVTKTNTPSASATPSPSIATSEFSTNNDQATSQPAQAEESAPSFFGSIANFFSSFVQKILSIFGIA